MNRDDIIKNQRYYIFIKLKKGLETEYAIFPNYIKNI